MDIGSKKGYPSSSLSNFAGHRFVIDGIECASMEGFLQSLKFKNPDMQKEICTYIGMKAKFAGKKKKWWKTQKLYWMNKEYDRHSLEYQELLDEAYDCLYKQSEPFRKALKASQNATFTHSVGKNDESRTVLTEREFCGRLTAFRREL